MNATRDEVVSWMRRHAIVPAEPNNDEENADLRSFDAELRETRVIGFGDTTHGTREFFHERLRWLRYLISEHGVRALAIEASMSATQKLNDILISGEGDLDRCVTNLKAITWNVLEFLEILRWLRAFNASQPKAKRVRIYGLDVWNNDVACEQVMEFVSRRCSNLAPRTAMFVDAIRLGEVYGIPFARARMDRSLLREAQALLSEIGTAGGTPGGTKAVERYLRAIIQWLTVNFSDAAADLPKGIPKTKGFNGVLRSHYMAKNLSEILEKAPKVVVWAHIHHLSVGAHHPQHGHIGNMGAMLRRELGDKYFVFALEFYQGKYLAREFREGVTLGPLVAPDVPQSSEWSLPSYLALTGLSSFTLNLRDVDPSSLVGQWLREVRPSHSVGWCHTDNQLFFTDSVIGEECDGLIFIEESTPTTATKSACAAAEAGTAH